jgi:hypothetical protein
MLSSIDFWLRIGFTLLGGIISGLIIGMLLQFFMSILYTEEAIHDATVKEFKMETLRIEDAWEVNVYPNAEFDVLKYSKPKENEEESK